MVADRQVFGRSRPVITGTLLSTEDSLLLDAEAAEWGFNTFSLVEAAGRSCAKVFSEAFPTLLKKRPRVTVAAGQGNNGADAMVMLRYWIITGLVEASASALLISRPAGSGASPRDALVRSLEKMKVPVLLWNGEKDREAHAILAGSDIILDGIAGTGLKGSLYGTPLEMAEALNSLRKDCSPGDTSGQPLKRPFIVSVDIPSGNSDSREYGMPIVEADTTLAIEPRKYCLYTPAARPYAGIILPVGEVFPHDLITRYRGAELLDWESGREKLPKIPPDAYKHKRGSVEIRAGSPGATGAALIAARGAQAAGAGLVRLVADDGIYPILAAGAGGIMVAPASAEDSAGFEGRFMPDAVLLGPGWGKGRDRALVLEKALELEKKGIPLVLDADAIALAKDRVFSGNVILTPHPGELSGFTGIESGKLLSRPAPLLLEYARERNAVILFKSHVITIASPDGRLGVADGMLPGLASGGSGDLLAGFCAAAAARMFRSGRLDLYNCAAAAAALLIASGKSGGFESRFTDPLELADRAAGLAGEAWLSRPCPEGVQS